MVASTVLNTGPNLSKNIQIIQSSSSEEFFIGYSTNKQ